MNKLMKFCGKCEEAFADRFAFCPNCGGELETYEMNPVAGEASAEAQSPHAEMAEMVATPVILAEAAAKEADVLEIPEFEAAQSNGNGVEAPEIAESFVAPVAAEAVNEPAAAAAPAVFLSEPKHEVPPAPADNLGWREVKSKSLVPKDDGLYHLTMVENHTLLNDPRLRATGLFALLAVVTITAGSMIYDLFTQYVNVSDPMQEDLVMASFPLDPDASIEDILQQIKAKDDNAAGGGGGGGGHDDDQPHQGNIPPMFKNKPDLAPSTHDRSLENPTMPLTSGITGPIDRDGDRVNPGVPKGASKLSDGMGDSGIGMNGSGGVGYNGRNGYGANGDGGIGNVPGTGIGNRTGDGQDGNDPPSMPKGPSKGILITSKPQPQYTEEARKNAISGTVRLRVIFNSNGSIGSITAVSGLGYGLTEKAIAAARNIRFEPALKNGQPTSVSKTIEYNFNLY